MADAADPAGPEAPAGALIAEGLERNDPVLLDRLVGEYQRRLLRYLIALTRSLTLAEDLFQETWLHVLERGRQYDRRRRFDAWLFAIARHLAIDRLRRRAPAPLGARPAGHPPADHRPSPLEAAMQAEQGRRLGAALERLPARYREVLLLRFAEELSLEDVAAVTGSPLASVKSRLYRGLELMRRRMEGTRR